MVGKLITLGQALKRGRWVEISGHVTLLCCSYSFTGLKVHTGMSLVEDMEILTPTITQKFAWHIFILQFYKCSEN